LWRFLSREDELIRHLQLRFDAYSSHPMGARLLPAGTGGLDLDEYDPVSYHFGLFAADLAEEVMVGTHRHVPATPGDPSAVFLELCERRGLSGFARRHRAHPLPMFKYLPRPEPVAALVNDALAKDERVIEPTRATVASGEAQDFWGSQLFRHLAESAAAECYFFRGDALIVMTCVPAHAVAYRRMLGWRHVPGTEPEDFPQLGGVTAVVTGRPADLPAAVRDRCVAMAARIARTGAACRCAGFPECLGGPYESGAFGAIDMFCPLRAKEILVAT
jgi:hypothetical protein